MKKRIPTSEEMQRMKCKNLRYKDVPKRAKDSPQALDVLAATGRLASGELTLAEVADRYGGRVALMAARRAGK